MSRSQDARETEKITRALETGHYQSHPTPSRETPLEKGPSADVQKSETWISQTTTGGSELRDPTASRTDRRPSGWIAALSHWSWELLSCLLSIATLVAIIVVLGIFDGHSLPSLPLHLTLNALLAYLVTFAKACMMIPLAECIGQWKWAWFRAKPRPLQDFGIFDAASRGLWGSLQLLLRSGHRHVVTIGAFVSIVAIVASPVTQQVVSYPTRLAPTNQASTVPASWYLNITERYMDSSDVDNYMSMDTDKFEGLTSLKSSSTPAAPVCPTGNCTYTRFHSLGMCTKFANITSLLNVTMVPKATPDSWLLWHDRDYPEITTFNISLPLPRTWFLSPVRKSLVSYPLNSSLMFSGDRNLDATAVFNYAVIYYDNPDFPYPPALDTPLPRYEAVEVLFHFCVMDMNVSVTNAIASTNPTAESYETLSASGQRGSTLWITEDGVEPPWNRSVLSTLLDPSLGVDFGYLAPRDTEAKTVLRGPPRVDTQPPMVATDRYTVTDKSRLWFTNYFMLSLLAGLQHNGTHGEFIKEDPLSIGHKTTAAVFGLPENTTDISRVRFERLKTAISDIAVGTTNTIRSWPTVRDAPGPAHALVVNGTALSLESYVAIHWAWLTLLAAQILVGTVFVVATVVATARGDEGLTILKNSPLATLSAFGADSRALVGGTETLGAMDRRARFLRAQMVGGELVVYREE